MSLNSHKSLFMSMRSFDLKVTGEKPMQRLLKTQAASATIEDIGSLKNNYLHTLHVESKKEDIQLFPASIIWIALQSQSTPSANNRSLYTSSLVERATDTLKVCYFCLLLMEEKVSSRRYLWKWESAGNGGWSVICTGRTEFRPFLETSHSPFE